jgi:uncharacterized membrane protein
MDDRDELSTALIAVGLVIVAVVVVGGLAMTGMMGFGMMGRGPGLGGLLLLVPVVIVVLLLVVLLGTARARPAQYQMAPYPQPYPMQPPVSPTAPQQAPTRQVPPRDPAVETLEDRLARGEISEAQYLSAIEALRKGRGA